MTYAEIPASVLVDVTSLVGSVATVVVVILTLFAVRSGNTAAKAAEASARLAEREIQEAHRPVLLLLPMEQAIGGIHVGVRNIGAGPALAIRGEVELRHFDAEGVRRMGRISFHGRRAIAGLAAGESEDIDFVTGSDPTIRELLLATVTYNDPAGNVYETTGSWSTVRTEFERVHVRHLRGPYQGGTITAKRPRRWRRQSAGRTTQNRPDPSLIQPQRDTTQSACAGRT